MTSDPLASARLLIEHAKTHVVEAAGLAKTFFDTKPYAYRVRPDPLYRRKVLHSIGLTAPLPAQVSLHASDAIKNLRAALDHAGFAVACANGTTGKHAHFPFRSTAAEVESRRSNKSKHIPPEVFDLMAAFRPYKGGNTPLWALNRLCNANKHETLLIPVLAAENMVYEADGMRLETGYRESENGEMPVCWRDVGKPNPYLHLQVEVSIRFDDVDGIHLPTNAIALLNAVSAIVEKIVTAVEARAKCLGLF